MLKDQMLAVMADVNGQMAEREELVEAIAVALLTRKNLFVLGEPGQAKSFAIDEFRRRITGARKFKRLLTKQGDEEQLFGRIDLSSLLPGSVPAAVLESDAIYANQRFNLRCLMDSLPGTKDTPEIWEQIRKTTEKLETYRAALAALHRSEPEVQTTGKIPESDIVFLDEIFKANDGVLMILCVHHSRPFHDLNFYREKLNADIDITCIRIACHNGIAGSLHIPSKQLVTLGNACHLCNGCIVINAIALYNDLIDLQHRQDQHNKGEHNDNGT